jgi:hypothetical protein
MSIQKHLYEFSNLKKHNVGGPTDDGINIGLLNGEVDSHSVQSISLHICQNTPHHLAMHLLSKLSNSYSGSFAFIN